MRKQMANHGNRFDLVEVEVVDVPTANQPDDVPTERAAKRRLQLLDLNGKTCRWGFGTPGEPEFFFCGESTKEGLPYCGPHCARAYNPPRREPMRKSVKAGAFV